MTLEERIAKLEQQMAELLQKPAKRSGVMKEPTAEEVDAYIEETYPDLVPFGADFVDFYAARGWMIGKIRMKSWKHAVGTWVRRRREEGKGLRPTMGTNQPNLGFKEW